MILEYKIKPNDENKTVKDILKNKLNISNRLITKLKLNNKIFMDDKNTKINDIVSGHIKVTVNIDFEEEDNTIPQEGKIEILYEDEYFLAVNKPADMVVHPCSYHLENTLANYVKYYLANNRKIRPINRIDNGTSGIVLFAKNEYIQEAFKNLKEKPIKEYIAITYGLFDKKEGTISYPIARKADSIIEREVNIEAGSEAITHYEVIKEKVIFNTPFSILKVLLETGRTHQIRVHMSHIGHSLVGDTLYTSKKINEILGANKALYDMVPKRQALHAYRLFFKHPILKHNVEIFAPLPDDLNKIIENFNI